MRCLTLANALAALGSRCTFLCRNLPHSLAMRLENEGHNLIPLPQANAGQDDLPHSAWLGTTMAQDAAQVAPILDTLRPSWLVIDHYALDARWTAAVRGKARVVVIDDLADRRLDADLLIDATAGRHPGDYDTVLPKQTPRLIGPNFALLRPEFATLRAASLARQRDEVRDILITMGGVDADNATGAFLDKLAGRGFALTAVIGGASPHIASLKAKVASIPGARLVINTPDMAALMAQSDLCIGAAGSTAWERCALGLPALTVVLAENQIYVAQGLANCGAARTIVPSISATDLYDMIQCLDAKAMSQAASALSDGKGARRIAAMMQVLPGLRIRVATLHDGAAIWHWRSAQGAERFYRSPQAVSLSDHLIWYQQALLDPDRELFIIELKGEPAAHVRIDRTGTTGRISIVVDPAIQGQRIAAAALALTLSNSREVDHFDAVVHEENSPSMRLFDGFGFRRVMFDPPFHQFAFDWSGTETL